MIAGGLEPLPLAPLTLLVRRLLAALSDRHPQMFARLGASATKTFLIDPIDLPFVFILRPDAARPSAEAVRHGRGRHADARIVAPLAVLIGLVQGAYDGDAMFFSRDLMIEGDVEAVLALRNAIDDAEIDLIAAVTGMLGPLRGPARRLLREMSAAAHWLARVLPAAPAPPSVPPRAP